MPPIGGLLLKPFPLLLEKHSIRTHGGRESLCSIFAHARSQQECNDIPVDREALSGMTANEETILEKLSNFLKFTKNLEEPEGGRPQSFNSNPNFITLSLPV